MFKPLWIRNSQAVGLTARAWLFLFLIGLMVGALSGNASAEDGVPGQKPIKVLFLGDQGHHRPADLYRVLGPAMRTYGIEVTYSEDVATSLSA